jgi:hypothetical protein
MDRLLSRSEPAGSDEFGNVGCGPCCPVVFNVPVHHLAANLLRDRCGDDLWRCLLEVQTATSLIAVKAVPHMEILLEMVTQRSPH